MQDNNIKVLKVATLLGSLGGAVMWFLLPVYIEHIEGNGLAIGGRKSD